jgi:hypothetical protein
VALPPLCEAKRCGLRGRTVTRLGVILNESLEVVSRDLESGCEFQIKDSIRSINGKLIGHRFDLVRAMHDELSKDASRLEVGIVRKDKNLTIVLNNPTLYTFGDHDEGFHAIPGEGWSIWKLISFCYKFKLE